MTWDLREQTLLAQWRAEGHDFIPLGGAAGLVGSVICTRCKTIVHVRSRARALAGDADASSAWDHLDPRVVVACEPRT
jgi:hypothetical protein